jgi:hypothetical protein
MQAGVNVNWIGVVEFICGFSDTRFSIADVGLVVVSLATLIPSLFVWALVLRNRCKEIVGLGL